MDKKLAIVIPCYNQVDLLKQTLAALTRQTRKDFFVVLLDDASSQDYRTVALGFPELEIRYERNAENLGAMRNLFKSIAYNTAAEYVLSLHEDDILHRDFVAAALGALEQNPDAAFVGCIFISFNNYSEVAALDASDPKNAAYGILGRSGFIRYLLQGNNFTFGSVVYRRSFLNGHSFDLEKFDIACDRPFLAGLIGDKKCAVLNEPLIFYRSHGAGDSRGKNLTHKHVFKLFAFYLDQLPKPLSRSDAKAFYSSSTDNILLAYCSLLPENRPGRFSFISQAKQAGLLDFRYLGLKGIIGIMAMFLGQGLIMSLIGIRSVTTA